MATVNKNFKIKSGLVVEGTTGTINGYDILTKNPADDQHIINLIGGTATPENTPDTVVKRDANGSFAADTVTANTISIPGAGSISEDGELLIAAESGEDIRLSADDVRVDAVDDFRVNVGGDILLATSGVGTNAYVGSIDTGNEIVVESRLDAHIGDATVDGTAGNTVYDRIFNAKAEAIADAGTATDTKLTEYTKTSDLDTTIDGYGYLKSADLTGYATESYVDTAEQDAKSYADSLISDASTTTTNTWSAYKIDAEISAAQTAAEGYADTAIANLVDSAPATLDTLNELAAALQDNPDIITDLQNIAAGKQDTLTAGSNIDITNDVISVTGLTSVEISDFNSAALSATAAAYDPAGSALTAENNAKSYADGLAVNYDAAGSAANAGATAEANANTYTDNSINALDTDDIEEGINNLYFTDGRAKDSAAALLTNATLTNIQITGTGNGGLTITAENGVADSDTDDLVEGSTNLYFTDQRAVDALEAVVPNFEAVEIDSIAKQVAATTEVATASTITAFSWAKADFRTAKFLVKTAYGTHTDVAEVLLTLDTSDNIAITEYAMVGTNGSAMTISADVDGVSNLVRLRVATVNNNSTVNVVGTLLA